MTDHSPHDVVLVSVEQRPTAVIPAITTWAEYPALWPRLLDEVHAGVTWDGGGHKGRNVMLYRDHAGRLEVEVGVELDQPARVGRPLRSVLPAGPVAMTVHRGSYDGLAAAHDAVRAFCADRGIRLDGVRWEVYGHWFAEPERLETEVFYLLA